METLEGRAGVVTGGGRGIGADVAAGLAAAGMRLAVTGRTRTQVEAVAAGIGALPLVGDVSRPEDVRRVIDLATAELGAIDLLVNNAGVNGAAEPFWAAEPDAWWRVFEVNVRGPQLCCRAVLPGMLQRRRGRIVNMVSGAAYLANLPSNVRDTSYPASKAAVARFTEMLQAQLQGTGVFAFAVSPGLVRTAMTKHLPDDAAWTPPEAAPRLIRQLAEGRADGLAGRYLHAEHDADLEALVARLDEVRERDLHAIRLQR